MSEPQEAYGFTALQDFWCEELKSQYAAGMGYRVKAGNAKLHRLVQGDGTEENPGWLAEGKVRLGRSDPKGVAAGTGEAR